MSEFDKRMATDVIEDAFMDLDTPYGRGVVSGLCGAFYMCGLLNETEWKEYVRRIPGAQRAAEADGMPAGAMAPETADRGRLLN